jgi:hypothetical protein
MRYKGRYVAQIVIDFDILEQKGIGMLPFEEIKKKTIDGELTDAIKDVVVGEVIDDYGTVTVTQQYADMYEVKEERREE